MKEEKIGEIDLRNPPQEISIGFRMVLLKMALEVKLRETFGNTDEELKTHQRLMNMGYDHRFIDGIIDEGNYVGVIDDVECLLYMSIFEQTYKEMGICGEMYTPMNNDVLCTLPSRMPRNSKEMLYFFYEEEPRQFGVDIARLVECA